MNGKKTGGRAKGTPNKGTVEARAFCGSIVDDPLYQAKLRRRAIAGTLPPGIEALIWHYAKGRPRESVDLTGGQSLVVIQWKGEEIS